MTNSVSVDQRIYLLNELPVSDTKNRRFFGRKAQGLGWLMAQNMPVPPGFVVPMHMDIHAPDFRCALRRAIDHIERETRTVLGDKDRPLLVSARSGGAVSMPGMMDTILNIGLNRDTVHAIGHRIGSLDTSRHMLDTLYSHDIRFNDASCSPDDVLDFLHGCVHAVFNSWANDRAQAYCAEHGLGTHRTAVVVQAMVLGNGIAPSGSGVVFTRCPTTGIKKIFGEYVDQQQGECLVSGQVTPCDIHDMADHYPEIYDELTALAMSIDAQSGDMQDIEFTYEKGKVWILQTRSGKRTPQAAFAIAHSLVNEGHSVSHALGTIDPVSVEKMTKGRLANAHELDCVGTGLPASSGAATGLLVLDPQCVTTNSILVVNHTMCDDMPAMIKAAGVVTLHGGMTSHAAVVMRGIGKPCITSVHDALIEDNCVRIGNCVVRAGEQVTIDGTSGRLYKGRGHIDNGTATTRISQTVMTWAKDTKQMTVMANADTVHDIEKAVTYGAEGIGLCRSEHMMFNAEHLHCLRGALLLPDAQGRGLMVARLQELHHQDSVQLMTAAAGKPLVIRLLDPPLHEFLPATVTSDMRQQWGISPDDLQQCIDGLSETNPMMGHRGCRLFLSHPELYTMQINALCQAVQTVHRQGGTVRLSILIPFIADVVELRMIVDTIRRAMPSSVACSVGTMIETPRACLVAGELAPLVDFFSFGTNDLTQMTWGVSRDDSAWLMDCYRTHGIMNPFMSFDRTGVGALMQHACDQGRRANPQIKFSVCGEHAGCPDAIAFFHDIGIHSISCAPNRVMTAIVASAQSGASRHGLV